MRQHIEEAKVIIESIPTKKEYNVVNCILSDSMMLETLVNKLLASDNLPAELREHVLYVNDYLELREWIDYKKLEAVK